MNTLSNKLFRVADIRAMEKQAIANGVAENELMERAGKAAYQVMKKHFSIAMSIAVVCGKGNNGGDGYVLARLAKQDKLDVHVYALSAIDALPDAARNAAEACRAEGVEIVAFDQHFAQTDVIVDALLGIGIEGQVREDMRLVIQAMNDHPAPTFAIDIPSGLHADTGAVLGEAVQAQATITFIGMKQGLLTGSAPAYCGQFYCDDLELSPFIDQTAASALCMSQEELKQLLPARRRDAHKGAYGHVLVVGGDHGMPGAVHLAGEAAARVGAGLVSVATRAEHVAIVTSDCPELMTHAINDADDLQPLLEKANVVVVGPGLGQSSWSKTVLKKVFSSQLPLVVDADALNLLAKHASKNDTWVLTPHPGEAARLLGSNTQAIQTDRFASAKSLQQKYGGVVVLKGAGTIIQTVDNVPFVCDLGNPGMASGGMGDVLSGVIAGLIAQGIDLPKAARQSVWLHARSADLAAEQAGERGLLATDLMPYLHQLVNLSS